jgi:hypothetical protein
MQILKILYIYIFFPIEISAYTQDKDNSRLFYYCFYFLWGMHKVCDLGAWQFESIATGRLLEEFNGND